MLDPGANASYPPNPVVSPDGRWLLASTRLPDPPSVWDSRWLDGARCWLPARRIHGTLTVLYDSATGEELLRLSIEGNSENYLAPDGQMVLTETSCAEGEVPSRRLQAWPVPAQRPWPQIAGIPLACAAARLAMRWTWRRWRKPVLVTGAESCCLGPAERT
jgi:hypothetical protein